MEGRRDTHSMDTTSVLFFLFVTALYSEKKDRGKGICCERFLCDVEFGFN